MGNNHDHSERRTTATRRTLLSASAVTAAAVPLMASPAAAVGAATGGPDVPPIKGPGRSLRPQSPSSELRRILREVDPDRIEAIIEGLVSFGSRHTLSSQDDPARGIGAARDWLYNEMLAIAATSGGRMTVEKQSFVQPVSPRIPTPTVITNVIGTIRGASSPDRVYVLTGHYDSRVTDVMNFTSDSPGADDDASGVAVGLEILRILASRPMDSTIVFAAVAGEEQGLYGSTFMAQEMKDAGTQVFGMFSNDIVGSSTADDGERDRFTVRLFTEGVPTSETPAQASIRQSVGGENDSNSRQLGRFVTSVANNSATGMDARIIYRRDRYLRGSDHIPFLRHGYAAARFTEPNEDFAHEHQDTRVENGKQFGDLIEFCDMDYIARVTRVNLATVWSLSQGPGTPQGVIIVTTNLTNDSELRWTRGPEADLAGYEVVWRETTEDDWTRVIDAGDVTTATINLSKDNVQFGVRAVNTRGLHSPVAFPVPGS